MMLSPDNAHLADRLSEIDISPETIAALKRHEGYSAKIYLDTEGLRTIGFGTLIEDGISREEATLLLVHRLRKAIRELQKRKPQILTYPMSVRRALRRMAYNMGVPRLLKFKLMWAALDRGDWKTAATEALDSLWARQVGVRAERVASLIRNPRSTGIADV